jgi:hypothetical protein
VRSPKTRVSKQRNIDAAIIAFNTSCSGLPITFHSDATVEILPGRPQVEYESILSSLISVGTTLLTYRAFTVAKLWNTRLNPFHGQGRAILRRVFPDDWKKREVQIYEWARIAKLVPPDDVDYSKPWEYYRRVYGGASGSRRTRWQDLGSYRDGEKIVFIESRNGREEIHAKSVSEILALLSDENGVVE